MSVVLLKGGSLLCTVPAAILAIALAWVALCFTAMFFALRAVYWLYVEEGRIYRLRKSQKSRIKAIQCQGEQTRTQISNQKDRRSLNELLRMTHKALDSRENEIMINNRVRTKLMLADCKDRQDFDTTLQIYRLILDSEPGTLDQLLRRQIS